jgi:ACS family glucarate transporter-like MFS transporter
MTDPIDTGMNPVRPTRARFILVFFLCSLAAILYLDRMCFAQAVEPIQNELGLSNKQISYIPMGFMLAYGFFAVFMGRLGDRFGSRAVLVQIVVAWSIFTALTGAANGLAMLIAMQFLFGVSESGTFPNTARVISRWFPLGERGRVQGLLLTAAQFGAVIAPTAAAHLIEAYGWRWVFVIFALLGVLWASGFWLWYRDNPADHPSVNAEELAIIRANAPPPPADPGPIPWRRVFTNRGILFLSLIMILTSFNSYFYYTWFPKYLSSGRGLSNLDTGNLASFVQVGAAAGVLFGGWLADRIPRWFDDSIQARRVLGLGCYLVAAILLFAASRCDDSLAMAALCALSFGIMQITNPNWWSMIIPQAGRHVGALFGLANGLGGLGAMASMGFVGVFADWQQERGFSGRAQWDPLFDVYIVVLLLGAVAWWLYRFRPLEEEATNGITESK